MNCIIGKKWKKTIKNPPFGRFFSRYNLRKRLDNKIYDPECKPHNNDTDNNVDNCLASALHFLFITTSSHDLETSPEYISNGNDRYECKELLNDSCDSIPSSCTWTKLHFSSLVWTENTSCRCSCSSKSILCNEKCRKRSEKSLCKRHNRKIRNKWTYLW